MHNLTFFLICCIVAASFYQSAALRRIKRNEPKKQPVSPTKDAGNIGKDLVRIRPDPVTKDSAKETDWSKDELLKKKQQTDSPVSSLQHAISSSLASASDSSKHDQLRYSNINDLQPNSIQGSTVIADSSNNNNLSSENVRGTSTLVKPQQKKSSSVATSENNMGLGGGKAALAYLFGNHKRGERFNQNMREHESGAADGGGGGGGGAAEVVIIDNSLHPSEYNSNYNRKPNLRSITCNVKRIAELTKNNINNHNNINNIDHEGGSVDADIDAVAAHNNKINSNNIYDDKKSINHNDKTNTNIESDNISNDLRRHNNNSNDKRNNNNSKFNNRSNNDNNNHDTCIDRTKNQERKSVSSLLSRSKNTDSKSHQQQLQKLHQHDGEHSQQGQQQKQQLLGHLNGKLSSMENILKFANMMLYKVGLDGAPIHAQGAQVSINSNPTITFASNPGALEGDDFDAIDYFYNTLDTQPALIRSPNAAFVGAAAQPPILSATGSSSSAALGSTSAVMGPPRPFFMQSQYSSNDPVAQPFNFLESALDFLLAGAGGEDDGEDEIELRCPVHPESKKKSIEAGGNSERAGGAAGGGDPGNDLIQVCSCRFFKKKKNT